MKTSPKKALKYEPVVLIPTDFSEVCRNAINHGAELAQYLKFKICILHVIDRQTKAFLKKEGLGLEYIDEKLKEYKKFYEKHYKVKVDIIAREGSIFKIINKVAAEIKANIMMLGTHGKRGFQHLFGSFALRVVLDSPCPVVVVQARSFGDGYHNIVMPISNDLDSRQKIEWVLLISRLFNSKIHLFQSLETDGGLNARLKIITVQITKVLDENKIPYEIIVAEKTGDFANQVISYGVEINTDMIMIMTAPHVDVPGFSVAAWDEKMMFNETQIPVMCINPTALATSRYEWTSLV